MKLRYRRVFLLKGLEREKPGGYVVLRVAEDEDLLKQIAHEAEKSLDPKGWIVFPDEDGCYNRIRRKFPVKRFWRFVIEPVDFVEEEENA